MIELSDNSAEVIEALVGLDRELAAARRTALERAVTAGAEEARTNHRFESRTGATIAGIKGYVTDDSPMEVTGVLESTGEASVFLNEGTRPHVIVAATARALHFEASGQGVFSMDVHHPGTDADPFFEHGMDKAEEVLLATMEEGIEKLLGGGD